MLQRGYIFAILEEITSKARICGLFAFLMRALCEVAMIMQPKESHERKGKMDDRIVVPDDPPTLQEVIDQMDADVVRHFLIMLSLDLE